MSTIARVGKIKEKDQSIYQRIAKGVNSPQAGELKDLLSAAGYKGLGTGNKFGAKAVKALKQFQENQGMAATGVADDDAWTALLAQFDGVSPQGNPYNTFQGGSADLADLTATEVNRPGGYVSPYQDQIVSTFQAYGKSYGFDVAFHYVGASKASDTTAFEAYYTETQPEKFIPVITSTVN